MSGDIYESIFVPCATSFRSIERGYHVAEENALMEAAWLNRGPSAIASMVVNETLALTSLVPGNQSLAGEELFRARSPSILQNKTKVRAR